MDYTTFYVNSELSATQVDWDKLKVKQSEHKQDLIYWSLDSQLES